MTASEILQKKNGNHQTISDPKAFYGSSLGKTLVANYKQNGMPDSEQPIRVTDSTISAYDLRR